MTEKSRSVAVTGIGVVSPIGIGRQEFWTSLTQGRSGITELDPSGTSELPTLWAPVPDFHAKDFISAAHLRRMDKLSRMIVAASRMALDDAGNVLDGTMPEDAGVVVGSAIGDVSESVANLDRMLAKGPAFASPMLFPNLVLNAPASYVAMELGLTGSNLTVAHGEASGEEAIRLGCDLIRAGRADFVLAGGGDELAPIVVDLYRSARALAGQRGGREWCSPYDVERSGLVLGEGAAMLVLESPERAVERGALVYAEIVTDAHFTLSAPLYDWPESAADLRPSVADRLVSDDVDLIFGSANSSLRLDSCELDLLRRLLGKRASHAVVTSIKGATGELGAAGALSAAALCLSLREQVVPPLCHLREPEPGSPLRFAGPTGESRRLDRALLCGIARGGGGMFLSLQRSGSSDSATPTPGDGIPTSVSV
jgi:3-oxoacyl-[acyl-carrier-protein] synthase II